MSVLIKTKRIIYYYYLEMKNPELKYWLANNCKTHTQNDEKCIGEISYRHVFFPFLNKLIIGLVLWHTAHAYIHKFIY